MRQPLGHPLEAKIVGMSTVNESVETVRPDQIGTFYYFDALIARRDAFARYLPDVFPHPLELT